MSQVRNGWLQASGVVLSAGALLHLAIPLGGPAWYEFVGAPSGLVAMVTAGSLRPAVTCVAIASLLVVASAYAFSGAGFGRRLPLLRPVLGLIGVGLLVRGVSFIPLAALKPHLLSGICGKCEDVSSFLVATSLLCLFLGAAFVHGAFRARI